MIFLDAGPLIAFFNKRDNLYKKATESFKILFDANKKIITTNRVVSEVYDAIRFDRRIARKKDAKPALVIFDALAKSDKYINIQFVSSEVENKAIAILRAYPDQNFSFCDACSFALIDQLKLRQVFTYDLTDFQIYKFSRKISFVD